MIDKKATLKTMLKKKLMSKVDLEPTQIADQVHLRCMQRESETTKIIVSEMSELLNKLVSFSGSTTAKLNNDIRRNVINGVATCKIIHKIVLNVIANWQT